jgi:hypothetical protein
MSRHPDQPRTDDIGRLASCGGGWPRQGAQVA